MALFGCDTGQVGRVDQRIALGIELGDVRPPGDLADHHLDQPAGHRRSESYTEPKGRQVMYALPVRSTASAAHVVSPVARADIRGIHQFVARPN